MADKYDAAIAYLAEHPDEIEFAWKSTRSHLAGCLFLFATPDGGIDSNPNGYECGCLTMIRNTNKKKRNHAWTEELTEQIAGDERIPACWQDVTVAHLPVFAEWQRKLDLEIRGITNDNGTDED